MNKTYSAELENKLKKMLRLYLAGSAAVALIGIILAAVTYEASVPATAVMSLLMGILGVGIYAFFQNRILPLYRADRLMKQLESGEPEPFEGIFRGMADGKTMLGGVMMYKLRLDEGKRVGKEPVFRELSIPAIFGKPRIKEGTVLRGEASEGVVVASQLPPSGELKPRNGRYQVSTFAVLMVMVASALLWCGIYSGIHKQAAGDILNVAVCTPAHHEETETELAQAMQLDGIEVAFSYTNTIDGETVAMYLATFGSMDADILVLNGDQFAGVFENEAQPLETKELTDILGFEPRFATNGAGEATGVVLYIPGDGVYNANFPKLIDWIAVEKDVALVAAIRYGSAHTGNGQADLALVHLLTYLADK